MTFSAEWLTTVDQLTVTRFSEVFGISQRTVTWENNQTNLLFESPVSNDLIFLKGQRNASFFQYRLNHFLVRCCYNRDLWVMFWGAYPGMGIVVLVFILKLWFWNDGFSLLSRWLSTIYKKLIVYSWLCDYECWGCYQGIFTLFVHRRINVCSVVFLHYFFPQHICLFLMWRAEVWHVRLLGNLRQYDKMDGILVITTHTSYCVYSTNESMVIFWFFSLVMCSYLLAVCFS